MVQLGNGARVSFLIWEKIIHFIYNGTYRPLSRLLIGKRGVWEMYGVRYAKWGQGPGERARARGFEPRRMVPSAWLGIDGEWARKNEWGREPFACERQ